MKKLLKNVLRYVIYWVLYFLGKFFSRILNQIEVSGKEHIPQGEVFCLFSDHKTIADPWWIILAMMNFKKMIHNQKSIPVSVADSKNFLSGSIKKPFFKLMRCIPAVRDTKSITFIDEQICDYEKVIRIENQSLLIFVAGTRSRDGKIGRCKYGPAKLVIMAPNIKYIPVALSDGIGKIMPIKEGKIFSPLSFFHKARIVFGPEINFSDILYNGFDEKEKISLIRERVTNSIIALNA